MISGSPSADRSSRRRHFSFILRNGAGLLLIRPSRALRFLRLLSLRAISRRRGRLVLRLILPPIPAPPPEPRSRPLIRPRKATSRTFTASSRQTTPTTHLHGWDGTFSITA